ncbi:MAG: hypothetical protein BWX86_02514 [Verrucomicrobia bacterium ADurb.Bin122]|nr:MAG: hypothetical protein BWX86_02514 [Verrucomicrobia bacterium ADurb.Bin122]
MVARVDVEQRERKFGGPEGLFGEAQEADGVLAAGEEQRRALKLAGDFAQDVDGFGFEMLEVVEMVV